MDYVDLVCRLESSSDPLHREAAEAIKNLRSICNRMTDLGVDLEEQVAEQLQADVFWVEGDPQLAFDPEDAMGDVELLTPVTLRCCHELPSKIAVKYDGLGEGEGEIVLIYEDMGEAEAAIREYNRLLREQAAD